MDLLIDFSKLRGRTVRLVNTTANVPPGSPDPSGGVPYPQVMQFRVADEPVRDKFVLPKVLSSFRRVTHANAPAHGHRLIASPARHGGRPGNRRSGSCGRPSRTTVRRHRPTA
ncbi:hypothetical protein NKH77_35070 [Streptomyces sp. M19]